MYLNRIVCHEPRVSAGCVVGMYVGSMKAVRAKVEAGGNYRSVSASSRGVSIIAQLFMRLHQHHTFTLKLEMNRQEDFTNQAL